MRILLGADFHAAKTGGNANIHNSRLALTKQLFDDIVSLCLKNKINLFIHLGDLWTDKTDPGVTTLLTLHKCINKLKANNINTYLLCGNHEYNMREIYYFFKDIATPVIDEVKLFPAGNDSFIYLLPFMLPVSKYIDQLNILVDKAHKHKNTYLMSHISLKEGRPNLTTQLSSAYVGIKELCPSAFSKILLGDYHNHQVINNNIIYLGSPYQLDRNCSLTPGLWILDTEQNTLTSQSLVSFYPEYKTYKLSTKHAIEDYDARNYNTIYCKSNHIDTVKELYPDATVLPDLIFEPDKKFSRIDLSTYTTEESKIQKYVSLVDNTQYDITVLYKAGIKCLQKAKEF